MLVLLSGVSGAGKDTIKRELIKRNSNITSLPSYTDREPREGEVNGEIYNFISTQEFEELIKNLQLKYDGNIYYNFFFLNALNLYNSKPNVTNFKELIKINTVFGTLTAYKLFYVGCSRAKKILKVIVNYSQINKFHNEFKTKMNNFGFHVVE